MLFSILIPVYNAQKFIENTFHSALSQEFDDYEIVLFDDGSTDASLEICRSLVASHSNRARLIQGEHIGSLLARRALANSAIGEYLVFLDADDMLCADALSVLANCIQTTGADVILYDLYKKSHRGDELFTLPLEDNGVYSGEGKQKIYELLLLTKYLNSMCTKAVKKELFDLDRDYSIDSNITMGEDYFQTFPLLDKAKLIMYKKKVLYTYVKNDTSMTSTVGTHFYASLLEVKKRSLEYALLWRLPSNIMEVFWTNMAKFFCQYISLAAEEAQKTKDKQTFNNFIYDMSQNTLFKNTMPEAKNIGWVNRRRFAFVKRNRASELLRFEASIHAVHRTVTRIKSIGKNG